MSYQIPKRPTELVEYTLEEHKDKEDAPIFILKPLSVGKFDEALNLLTSGKQVTGFRLACHNGIKGWKNLEPEFSDVSSVELINRFEVTWLTELGSKLIEISQASEQEKNS